MVTARIDLQGLSEELNQFKTRFDAWALQSVASADAEKDKHLRHLRELQGEPPQGPVPARPHPNYPN
jgi:hypothetical protein